MQKAVALNIFAVSVSNGSDIMEACKTASSFTSFCVEVIRRWAVDIFGFFDGISSIDDVTDEVLKVKFSSNKGRHPKWVSLIHDENFKLKARKYIRQNAFVKGKPNLTLQQFVSWVKDEWGTEICTATASEWLHEMGFSHQQFSKGVYFDGHERPDVIEERKKYLATLSAYEDRMLVSHCPTPDPDSQIRRVIRVFHDESTFYSNADQTFHWSDGTTQALKQKSLGQAIMVSDFLEEVGGLLQFEGKKACLLLEHQSEGYFTNDMLIKQVHKAIDIFVRNVHIR